MIRASTDYVRAVHASEYETERNEVMTKCKYNYIQTLQPPARRFLRAMMRRSSLFRSFLDLVITTSMQKDLVDEICNHES